MRAALLESIPSDAVMVDDIDIAQPYGREVVVRTVAAGVCHSDLHVVDGKYPGAAAPVVLGHEAAGIVEAIGEDVTHVRPGDHVITCLSVFCGRCEYCLTGHPNLCIRDGLRRPDGRSPRLSRKGAAVQQFADLSSFAEMMIVHENATVKIRDDMPLDRAALIGCGVTTGLGAVFNTAKIQPGSTVAVIGCGGIGLNCIQGARIAGAGRIIAIDEVASKLEVAEQFGATDGVNASEADAVTQVLAITRGGVNYSFEAIGLKKTVEQAFAMIRKGGTATVIGLMPSGQKVELPGIEFIMEKHIQGSNMGSNRFRVDMPRYVDMYLNGVLLLDELISARIDLGDLSFAFERMRTGEVNRSVIVFNQ
jgi:S-(hydroxymethyl)glutathione dehydrogenase/alcohol dehydrogenase